MKSDPIWSTGVAFAMRSAEWAAETLARGLKSGGPISAEIFDSYERRFRRTTAIPFKMIDAFYSPGFAKVFLNPNNMFGVVDAMSRLLAGQTDMGALDRMRIRVFHLLIWLNNRLGFIKDPRPREHAVDHG